MIDKKLFKELLELIIKFRDKNNDVRDSKSLSCSFNGLTAMLNKVNDKAVPVSISFYFLDKKYYLFSNGTIGYFDIVNALENINYDEEGNLIESEDNNIEVPELVVLNNDNSNVYSESENNDDTTLEINFINYVDNTNVLFKVVESYLEWRLNILKTYNI